MAIEISANAGVIGQLKGPFPINYEIQFINYNVLRLGISIGEKDFMKLGNPLSEYKGFTFKINDDNIRMGRTYLYETEDNTKILKLSFPQGAPPSVIVEYAIQG